MAVSAMDQDGDWRKFVLAHGWRASQWDLAVVLDRSAAEIERLRRTGACRRLAKAKNFTELFSLWHGRAPTDEEWPAPRKSGVGSSYEWQAPEVALLASLVGRLGVTDIARVLTKRLQQVTGDRGARRTRNSVQTRVNQIGLQASDVVGGITTKQAAREIGSLAVIHHAIHKKQLRPNRVGRLWVIPHDAWKAWKAKRVFPPKGYVRLSAIREALGIRSDKTSEFARMGYIPTATRCIAFGTKGPSTQYGTWYIDAKIAAQLIKDRRAGRAMPWHGKVMPDNVRATFKLWQKRKHPASCKTCAEIWGKRGAPRSFEDYERRYPPLAHGAKRHLTRRWSPGLTMRQVAQLCGCSASRVRRAILNGALTASGQGRRQYVSRTDATRWRARRCPTGEHDRSWISLETARKQYLFTLRELRAFIRQKKLKSKIGTFGASRGVVYVARHQCAQCRERIGFTLQEAALRVGVSVPRLEQLLEGIQWRKATGIPLATVQAVKKRLESCEGYSLEEAATEVKMPIRWIMARIKDGTIKVSRAKWDRRRVYITAPMLGRLKEAKKLPAGRVRLGEEWLRLSDAAGEAGVSAATIMQWSKRRELKRRTSRIGWRYHRDAVRARSRRYWRRVRFHRAEPPEWLRCEMTSQTASATRGCYVKAGMQAAI